MFRVIRIVILFSILIYVAVGSWLSRARATAWEHPLTVAIYPINADHSARTAAYIRTLSKESFTPIEAFFKREGERYGLLVNKPIEIIFAKEVEAIPPQPPKGGNMFEAMHWSLQFRFWAWLHDDIEGMDPQVRMFVQFHDPFGREMVEHSIGLQKGMIGLVQAYADNAQADQNNVVIAHEMLHTVGASDKYDSGTNHPYFPDGYADPRQEPLLPQRRAELMGGRIPQTDRAAVIPDGLEKVVIGERTAQEINWLQ